MNNITLHFAKFIYKVCWFILNLLFSVLFPVKTDRLLFESESDFSDNGRALYEYMIREGYNKRYEIIWLVADPQKYCEYNTYNVKFVKKKLFRGNCRTLRSLYYACTSKFIFFTHTMSWILIRKKNQKFVNLWHGCGYKASKGNSDKIKFDYCLVPGKVFIKTKKEFFKCSEEKLLPIGYPRYDYFRSQNINALNFIRNQGINTKTVLWMPTFRKTKILSLTENTLGDKDIDLPVISKLSDLDYLNDICREKNINLLIKRHRLQLDYAVDDNKYSNISFLDDSDLTKHDFQLYELLAVVDALITDYSSVAIDFLLLDRPIGFTLDDYDKYRDSRGFVFENPLEYMPGKHIYNLQELADFLADVAEGKDLYKQDRIRVREKVHNETDNYSKRIVEYFNI